jgi:hypothetical protein
MSKLEENTGPVEIDEARLDDVSGGPVYMQLEGLKGSVTAEGSIAVTNVALGDGSVRSIG